MLNPNNYGSHNNIWKFNKIAIQGKMVSGQGSHRLIESPKCLICVTSSPEIFVNFVFKHIHAASTYSTSIYTIGNIYIFGNLT